MPASALIPKPKRNWRWFAAGGTALVFGLLLGGVFTLRAALESGRFTPGIEAAITKASGYRATIGGLGLALGLIPKLELRDVTLTAPDAAQPALLAPRLRASVALLPLLRGGLEIPSVEAEGLRVNLEAGSWRSPETASAASTPGRAASGAPAAPTTWPHIGTITLRDARITLPGSPAQQIDIPRLTMTEVSATSPSNLAAEWRLGSIIFTLTAQAGPLLGQAPGALPPLGAISLQAGAGDLGALAPGFRLEGLELRAPPDGEARLTGAISRNGSLMRFEAGFGALNTLLRSPVPAALPIDARASIGTARLTLKGHLARPRQLEAGQFDVALEVPDGTALAAFLNLPAPLSANAKLDWRDLRHFGLAGLTLRSPALAATGALDLRLTGRPSLSGQINITKLDLDALRPMAPATSPPANTPAPKAGDGRLIPDITLPVAALHAADLDLRLSVAELSTGGLRHIALETPIQLKDGKLALAPFAIRLPAGRLAGQFHLDAAAQPAALQLAFRSEGPGLDLAALAEAWPRLGARGRAEIAADLRGAGTASRAMAASLNGTAGLAIANGRLEEGAALQALAEVLALVSPGSQALGAIDLRCFALALGAEQGMARSRALLLDSTLGQISGQTSVNLADESLAGRLFLDLTLRGFRLRAPMGIGGSLAKPRFGVAADAALGQAAAGLLAEELARRPGLEGLGGLLGGGATRALPDCDAALRMARLGAEGPTPAPRPTPEATPREIPPANAPPALPDVLRGLGGILGGGRRP